MTKLIKSGDNIGVAKQVQGYRVHVEPHPVYKNTWKFEMFGHVWVASDYAFVEGSDKED